MADKYNNMLLNMLNRRDFKEAVEEDEDILKDVSVNIFFLVCFRVYI